jgi:hypothetical protein
MAPEPKTFDRSEMVNPYLSLEDQDMEMTPVVMGPPAYGSPDPETQAIRLVPLDENELGESLSADYGKDALDAGAVAGDTSGQDAAEEASVQSEEADPDDYSTWTVAQLDEEFGDVEGYPSSGNKADKVAFAESQREA